MAPKTDNLSVRLPADIRQKVEGIALRARRSRSYIIQEAVTSYVEAQEQYSREIGEAIKSADSGIGHSKEQVFAWLDEWKSGNKPPLPNPDIVPSK